MTAPTPDMREGLAAVAFYRCEPLGKGIKRHCRNHGGPFLGDDTLCHETARRIDAVLAHLTTAGWGPVSQARVVTSVEELEALPNGSRIVVEDGDDVLTKGGDGEWRKGPYALESWLSWVGSIEDAEDYLPALCIYTPDMYPATVLTPAPTNTVSVEDVARVIAPFIHAWDSNHDDGGGREQPDCELHAEHVATAVLALFDQAPGVTGEHALGYPAILAALRDSSKAFSGIGEELGTSEVAILVEDAAVVIADLLTTPASKADAEESTRLDTESTSG